MLKVNYLTAYSSTQGLKLKNSIQQLRQHLASAEYMLQQQLQPYIWNKAAGFHAIQAQQNCSIHPIKPIQISEKSVCI